MPFARLTLMTPTSSVVFPFPDHDFATELTDLIARDLDKKHGLTSVLIEHIKSGHWTIGANPAGTAAHLQVCVTTGTNTDAQKRTFIAHAMAALRRVLPELGTATYVIVAETPASDWGYDGLTQADRARKSPPTGPSDLTDS